MANYNYRARNYDGAMVVGRLDAASRAELIEKLREQGLILLKHKKESERGARRGFMSILMGPVPAKHLIPFTHHLKILQAAGVPILEGLEDVQEVATHSSLKEIIGRVIQDLRNGSSLSESLSKHPKSFSPFYTGIVRVGEATGKLDQCLERLADYLERREDTKNRLVQALTYPLLLAVALLGLIILLVTFVLPRVTSLYATLGKRVELPGITLFVMNLSNFVRDNWILLLAGFVAMLLAFFTMRQIPRTRYILDSIFLRLPFFGSLWLKDDAASFSHALVTLQKSGVDISESLERCEEVVRNTFIRAKIHLSRAAIEEGKTLHESMRAAKVFPTLVISMIKVGENTGKLDETLSLVCRYYDEEVPRAIKRFITFLEPAIIFFAGGCVLFLILATLLPIYQLMNSLL